MTDGGSRLAEELGRWAPYAAGTALLEGMMAFASLPAGSVPILVALSEGLLLAKALGPTNLRGRGARGPARGSALAVAAAGWTSFLVPALRGGTFCDLLLPLAGAVAPLALLEGTRTVGRRRA